MTTVFEDAWQNGGALDDHFGEAFVITPAIAAVAGIRIDDANAPRSWQTGTPPVTFVGVLHTAPAQRYPEARGHASSDAQLLTAGIVSVEFQVATIPFKPKMGDLVMRVSTGTTYEVSDPGEEVFGRRRVRLTSRQG